MNQRSGYRHSQQVILSPFFRVEPVGEWTLTNPCLVGRNTRMYTRNFAFRSFYNMFDNGRFRELIDEVTMLMYVQGTLYTVFNREMDFFYTFGLRTSEC